MTVTSVGHTRPSDKLGPAVAAWPELAGFTVGFHGIDAVETAVAMFPRQPRPTRIERFSTKAADSPVVNAHQRYWRLYESSGPEVAATWWRSRPVQLALPTKDEIRWTQAVEDSAPKDISLVVSPGWVRVRIWNPASKDPPTDLSDPRLGCQCANCVAGDRNACLVFGEPESVTVDGTRDVVSEFSRKSRRRMMFHAAAIDWPAVMAIGERMGMITVTYPGNWEAVAGDPETCQRHLKNLAMRFERAMKVDLEAKGLDPAKSDHGYRWEFRMIWKREFQQRGAPHFHLFGPLPRTINGKPLRAWLSNAWYQIVGSGDRRHFNAGTRIDWARSLDFSDPRRVAAYFAGYGMKDKGFQDEAPEGWHNAKGGIGRCWGTRRLKQAVREVRITPEDEIEIRRLSRKIMRARGGVMTVQPYRHVAYETTMVRSVGRETGEISARLIPVEKIYQRKRKVRRRYRLASMDTRPRSPGSAEREHIVTNGYTLLCNSGPAVAVQLARALDQTTIEHPKGTRRPLP